MLRVIQSNDMSVLTAQFCSQLANDEADPFLPVTVLTQSYGTGQWLKLQSAKHLGIAANISCQLPAHFIWQLYHRLLRQPAESPFRAEALAFRLMPLLRQSNAPDVRHYLAGTGDADLRCYQLALQVAGTFDRYLMYRPDWIHDWQANGSAPLSGDNWQADLWRDLVAVDNLASSHRVALHQQLLAALSHPGSDLKLPARLTVFGLSSLAPMQIETLRAVAAHCDVDVYFLNPCRHYWGDIVAEKDLQRRSVRQLIGHQERLEDEDYLEVGNPLLASFGKQGREFLDLLLEETGAMTADAYVPPPASGNLLHQVQTDILDLAVAGISGVFVSPEPAEMAKDDHSMVFHACHSRQRELEVLRNQLFDVFAHTDLRPDDVIIMAPSISDYAPFIHAVFQDQVHYGIADQALSQRSALVNSLLDLMALPDRRLTSVEVVDLLEVPAIARQLGLSEEDLTLLPQWIRDTGIRWELDGSSRRERWQVPATHQNTWRAGLDRALLGIALDSTEGTFAGVLPYDLTAMEAELLGKLCFFVDQLADFRKQISKAHVASDWAALLLELTESFFAPVGSEIIELEEFARQVRRLPVMAEDAGLNSPLSSSLVRYWVKRELDDNSTAVRFISGGLTFATLVPMRSIPFRMVCMLGMNDADFPRQQQPPGFDLMTAHYRKGDRAQRLDDRYLFLEALLSARDHLYISWEGKGSRDDKTRPPSVVVSELLSYARRLRNNVTVTEHPLQPYSRRYFTTDNTLTSYDSHWYEALAKPAAVTPFVSVPLKVSEQETDLIELAELERFFRHSGRYFVNQRLGATLVAEDVELRDAESFRLNNLEQYQLGEAALEALMAGYPLDAWQQDMIASGMVMEGPLGKGPLERALSLAGAIHREISPQLPNYQQTTLTLKTPGIQGTLAWVGDDHQLFFRTGRLTARHHLAAWLRHLFFNAALASHPTRVVSTTPKGVATGQFDALTPDAATTLLAELKAYHMAGQETPLCLPPEISLSVWQTLAKTGSAEAARDKAVNHWFSEHGAFAYEGASDPYWTRLFSVPDAVSDSYLDMVRTIFEPLSATWRELK